MCENGVGMTCASDGSFALEYFSDSYCMEPSGSTYDQLQTLNSNMNTYTNCQNVYQYGDQYGNVLVPYLMSVSYPCTSLVSGLCADSAAAVPPPSSAVEMDGTSGDDWSAFLMAAEGV